MSNYGNRYFPTTQSMMASGSGGLPKLVAVAVEEDQVSVVVHEQSVRTSAPVDMSWEWQLPEGSHRTIVKHDIAIVLDAQLVGSLAFALSLGGPDLVLLAEVGRHVDG